ncbi:uncharacterized protein LACBIDRAFT_330726 [Laccaria bicolor S238N-H82]|uniref:Predicted protein n=1 Tax=Laccaria bicolor (strain S238N-H82 / ATCC MYA-4686) TaxID=486041 RepID=B0DM88_LACBS|nr:uncharacterized protein LACBIDRAFT_330726 [Laccaria bicolor S238N-H82]EDR04236.1 predicted protein [Laccaria bicolor S238N-H82]|eukprot:XP_001885127.1 predicted protein [Laccaria bicolor S238N-H82]
MPTLALKPALRTIDLSKADGPSDAKVVVIPLPAKLSALSSDGGIQQRTGAEWAQRYNTYVFDTDYIVIDPQAIWDPPSDNSRFLITKIVPSEFDQNPTVLSIGPFNDDNYVAIHCSHLRPGQKNFINSDPHHSFVFAQGFFASTDGFEVASNEGHGVGDANKSHA